MCSNLFWLIANDTIGGWADTLVNELQVTPRLTHAEFGDGRLLAVTTTTVCAYICVIYQRAVSYKNCVWKHSSQTWKYPTRLWYFSHNFSKTFLDSIFNICYKYNAYLHDTANMLAHNKNLAFRGFPRAIKWTFTNLQSFFSNQRT